MSKAVLAVFTFLALTICSESGATDHVIYDLGSLDGYRHSMALAVNDSGVAVGYAYNNISNGRACAWDEAGIHDLGLLPGDAYSEAYAVNNKGQIVGHSYGKGWSHACLWDKTGIHRLPPLPGTNDAVATGINNKGLIVGYSFDAGDSWHGNFACYWDDKGVHALSTLPLPPDWVDYSITEAISENGLIAGVCRETACVWSKGRPNALPMPASGTQAIACGINNRGDAAGYTYIEIRPRWIGPVPCAWDSTGARLLDLLPGYLEGSAKSINNRGEIVGYSMNDYTSRATYWDRTGVHDLSVLPTGYRSAALGINNHGVIVGRSSMYPENATHAVLWQPTTTSPK